MPIRLDHLFHDLAGRYRLDRELGQGGMATVYLAHDLRHHRSVAIKVLRPDPALTLGHERFPREIEIAAPLVHQHIVSLLDSGEAGGTLFYVMPYLSAPGAGKVTPMPAPENTGLITTSVSAASREASGSPSSAVRGADKPSEATSASKRCLSCQRAHQLPVRRVELCVGRQAPLQPRHVHRLFGERHNDVHPLALDDAKQVSQIPLGIHARAVVR